MEREIRKLEQRLVILRGRLADAQISPLLSDLLTVFARHSGISREDLLGKSRVRQLVDARRVFVRVATVYGYSINELAGFLGKDQGSVRHYRDTYHAMILDADFAAIAAPLESRCLQSIRRVHARPEPRRTVAHPLTHRAAQTA